MPRLGLRKRRYLRFIEMNVFIHDHTFEGFLTLIFEAFRQKIFPEVILGPKEAPPLMAVNVAFIQTDPEKAERVWSGLEKKLSPLSLKQIMYAWLTEEREAWELVLRYIRAIYSGIHESSFAHPDILALRQTARKVSREQEHLRQFLRFQKTAEGLFFAAVAPPYNVLPLNLRHFSHRFADQKWLIWDLVRRYGYFYDLEEIHEVDTAPPVDEKSGRLAREYLAEGEILMQDAWRAYFKSVSIVERANPKLQRQFMPRRFWSYLTEMQDDG